MLARFFLRSLTNGAVSRRFGRTLHRGWLCWEVPVSRCFFLSLPLLLSLAVPVPAQRGYGRSSSVRSPRVSSGGGGVRVPKTKAAAVPRSTHRGTGRTAPGVGTTQRTKAPTVPHYSNTTKRDTAARDSFMKGHPCPATGKSSGACPGYVVDHVVPLKRGGPDAPSNMQWQTSAAAKAKDRVE